MNMDGEAAPNTHRTFRKTSFKRLSRRCWCIIVAVCVLCVLCIVLASTLGRKSKDYCPDGIHCDWRTVPPAQYMKDERCDSICTTKSCIRSAEFALSRIDVSKDPCNDFYEFACGKFEQDAVLFPDANDAALTYHEMENELLLKLKEIIDSVQEKVAGTATDFLLLAKKFYDDCMNTDHHLDVLDRNAMGKIIGEDGVIPWPLVNQSLENDDNQLTRIMALSIFYDENPFFSLSFVGQRGDPGEVNHKLIFHFQDFEPEQLLNIHTEPSGPVDDDHIYVQYASTINKILHESGVEETEIPKVSTNIREFEKKYKTAVLKALNSIPEKIIRHDDIPRFQKFDCYDAQKRMQSIQWCKVVENLLQEMGRPADSTVELRFPEIMPIYDAMNDVISQESKKDQSVVINYLVVKFIMNHLKYMPTSLREMFYRNPQLFPGDNKFRVLTSRWQQCVDVITDFFWIPLETEYMKEKISESEKEKITSVMNKMKEVYTSVANKVSWLDDGARRILTTQMQRMKVSFGNSFMWYTEDGEFLMKDIKDAMTFDDTSALKNNKLTLIEDVLEMKKLLRTKVPSSSSFAIWKSEGPFKIFPNKMGPHIRLFYGMLQFPMFLEGRPMYVEFATLGKNALTIMFGNDILSLLSENTTEIFQASLKCLTNQMTAHELRKSALKGKVDEHKRTYGNFHNTLASLATSEAYLKYLRENGEERGLPGLPFSNEQLFFISLAQVNCEKFSGERYTNYPAEYFTPSRERVNMPLSNSEAFSKAFRCESGSKMNPKKKCCVLGDGKSSEKCS